MLKLNKSKRFQEDITRVKRQGKSLLDLEYIIDLLLEDRTLPNEFSPHKLRGQWKGYWECHIEKDWLLIYKMDGTTLYLVRTGSHDELFDSE